MAEESENPGSGPQASAAGIDPAAITIALGAAAQNEGVAAKAEAFLETQRQLGDDQRKLVQLQARELAHELDLRHWSLLVRHVSSVLKLTLELAVGLLLLMLVAGLTYAIWNASHDNGLVIESFSVPPDLAARGLNGQVVATQMLDDLSSLQAQSASVRASSSYANNWGNDLKVEIPETGVSLGEAGRFLHQLLGHQTHISGELVRSATGLSVTARAGAEAGETFSGSESDFPALLKQAAEAVFARTQPYRYGIYLSNQFKYEEEEEFYRANLRMGSQSEQAWAYYGLSGVVGGHGLVPEATKAVRASIAADPDFAMGWYRLGNYARIQQQEETSLAAAQKAERLLNQRASAEIDTARLPQIRNQLAAWMDHVQGDYGDEASKIAATIPGLDLNADPVTQLQQSLTIPGMVLITPSSIQFQIAATLVARHDLAAARHILAQAPRFVAALEQITAARHTPRAQDLLSSSDFQFRMLEFELARADGNWQRVRQIAPALEAQYGGLAGTGNTFLNAYPPTYLWPILAYAEAKKGDFAAAQAAISKTPADCGLCLRTRGLVAAAEKQWGRADYWFARAVHDAPSIPFAHEDWGRSLLNRGKPDEAIAKFMASNKQGPHFADPLEGWAEALMAKNQSHLALAKFAEAQKYAPNWGRLHLKWGEALVWAGKQDEGKKQFARATELDLTPAEKVELAKVLHA